jgi:hypothetical protein
VSNIFSYYDANEKPRDLEPLDERDLVLRLSPGRRYRGLATFSTQLRAVLAFMMGGINTLASRLTPSGVRR